MRRRGRARKQAVPDLVESTDKLVERLLEELRTLRSENARLVREVDRLSSGWEQIRELARSAPRRRAQSRGR